MKTIDRIIITEPRGTPMISFSCKVHGCEVRGCEVGGCVSGITSSITGDLRYRHAFGSSVCIFAVQ